MDRTASLARSRVPRIVLHQPQLEADVPEPALYLELLPQGLPGGVVVRILPGCFRPFEDAQLVEIESKSKRHGEG